MELAEHLNSTIGKSRNRRVRVEAIKEEGSVVIEFKKLITEQDQQASVFNQLTSPKIGVVGFKIKRESAILLYNALRNELYRTEQYNTITHP